MSEAMDVMLKIGITERRIRNPHCTQAAQQCRLMACPRTAQRTEAYRRSVHFSGRPSAALDHPQEPATLCRCNQLRTYRSRPRSREPLVAPKYQWAEADGSNLLSTDVPITAWPNVSPRLCPGPDGLNWCRAADKRQATGWISNGVIGFMWSASQSPMGDPFPYPYVHVARFTASTTPALMDEPIIWNSGGAWIYPEVGVNDRGDIAGTLY